MFLCGMMVIKKLQNTKIKGKLAKNRIKLDIFQKKKKKVFTAKNRSK